MWRSSAELRRASAATAWVAISHSTMIYFPVLWAHFGQNAVPLTRLGRDFRTRVGRAIRASSWRF